MTSQYKRRARRCAEQTGMHLGYGPTPMRPNVLFLVLLSVVCSPGVSASIKVLDNNLPAIHGCAQTSLQVNERAGGVTFELTRSQNTTGTTTGYVRVDGYGKLDDYWARTATFAPGETTRLVEYKWQDDSVYNRTQRARFYCGGQGPGVSELRTEGTIVLTDDEPYPTVVAPSSIQITETDTPQQISIPFSFVPPFEDGPWVHIVLDHITTDDRDVKVLTTYPYHSIELEIAGDNQPESDESVSVRLVGEVQKGITLTIRDDDRPPFPYTFDRDSYEFDEGGGGSVLVQRTGSLSSPVELLLRIRPTIPGATIEEIPVVLEQGASSKEVLLALDDAYFTGLRYSILELELDGFVGATASFTVQDDDAMPSLSVGDGSVREGNLDQQPRLAVPVTLTSPLGAPLQLTLVPSHVSTDAADFAAVPETVMIFPGELTGTAVFEVNGDIAHEPDETFSVTVTACCDGLATVTRSTGTATIVNDDSAPTESIYRLALDATTFNEHEGWLLVPVRRFGRLTGTSHAILKLTADDDVRVFAPRTVSFAPNETENEARFYINDFWYSGNTIVKVELFDGDRLLETRSVSIVENESPPRTWIAGGTAREGTNAVPFTVHVSPPSGKPLVLHLRARSGTAAYGDDFPPFDKMVEVPPGTGDYEVAVPVRDDLLTEVTESFSVDILTADGAEIWKPHAPGSIEDDDTAYVVSEPNVVRGTLTTITVHLARPAPAKDTVLFLAEPRFLEGPLTVPVPAGANSVSFQVLAKTSGDISFAVEGPAYLQSVRMVAKMNIFDEQTVTLDPAALELAPGASARVVITTGSGQSFTMKSGDWTIAATQTAQPVDGTPSFLVHALAPGQTEIVVKLPASVGGAMARLPVVVKELPVPVTRRRAAGH